MNTATQHQNEGEPVFILTIIRGGNYYTGETSKRINDFWKFCHATFWPTEKFTQQQTDQFKKLISAHFVGSTDSNKRFKELIERATLAKRYISRRPWRYIAKPSEWLDIKFSYGLSGTAHWYDDIIRQRKDVATHQQSIQSLARAILNYCISQEPVLFAETREHLLEEKEEDLLNIYTNAIMHMHFLND